MKSRTKPALYCML